MFVTRVQGELTVVLDPAGANIDILTTFSSLQRPYRVDAEFRDGNTSLRRARDWIAHAAISLLEDMASALRQQLRLLPQIDCEPDWERQDHPGPKCVFQQRVD